MRCPLGVPSQVRHRANRRWTEPLSENPRRRCPYSKVICMCVCVTTFIRQPWQATRCAIVPSHLPTEQIHMRVFTLFLLTVAMQAQAQAPCSDVNILDLRYSAFDHEDVVIYCQNNSQTEIFNYPGFVLLNAQGDSVAGEQVNFFGLAGQHVTTLGVAAGQAVVTSIFSGTLELWTGFYETMACEFTIQEPLCPTSECNMMEVNIINMGGAITTGTFDFDLAPVEGGAGVTGSLTLDEGNQSATAQVCLPNGQYTLQITSQDAPLLGQPVLSVREAGPYGSPELTSLINNMEGSATLIVPIFLGCAQSPIGMHSSPSIEPGFQIINFPGGAMVDTRGASGQIEVIDLRGALLAVIQCQGVPIQLPLSGAAVVRFKSANGAPTSRLVPGF